MKLISFFKKEYTPEEMALFLFLRKNRLLEELSDEELALIAPYLYLREYRHNEVVFFTGDPSQAIYIVKSGVISLQLDLKDGFEKLMSLRSGRLFGDNALLNGTKRIVSAIVETEDAELYVIPKGNLMTLMNDRPAIRAKIMTAFAEIYNEYTTSLFRTYKTSLGFFDLQQVYADLKTQ